MPQSGLACWDAKTGHACDSGWRTCLNFLWGGASIYGFPRALALPSANCHDCQAQLPISRDHTRVAYCPLRLRIGLGTCRMLGELWGSIPDGRQSGMLRVLWGLVDREPIGQITCQRVHRYIGNSLYTTARCVRWWRRRWNPLDCAALSVKEMIRRSLAMLTPSWRRVQSSLVHRLRPCRVRVSFF
jgi:hypothetical protein